MIKKKKNVELKKNADPFYFIRNLIYVATSNENLLLLIDS